MSGVRVDFERLFEAAPSALLVLDAHLDVVEVNPAYCALLGRRRAELLGRPVFDLFPDNPDDAAADGVKAIRASLEDTWATGRQQAVPLQRYDIVDPDTGEYAERYWSVVNAPILDEHGETVLLLNRVEDVSAYVQRTGAAEDSERLARAGADVYARTRELQAAWVARAEASRLIAALSDVAIAVSTAATVAEVTDLVLRRGLAVLAADGGSVAVRDGSSPTLTVTGALGVGSAGSFRRLPVTGPLPISVAAATGQPVLLPDEAAAVAFAPEMAEVVRDTGCRAWVALPLHGREGVLGSLAVGWAEAHPFPDGEVALLAAFAAHCAQGIERIRARQAERAVATQNRRMAETLQLSLLTPPVQPEHLQVAVRYRPAGWGARAGGDWYDAFLAANGELCVVVGDVAGHDRDAVAAMGQIRNLLRGLALGTDGSPAEVVGAVDRAMTHFAVDSLATAVLARVEQTASGAQGLLRMRWSNAGHPPPLLVHPDGRVRLLRTAPELLMGVRTATPPPRTDHELLLPAGATLVLYTDGLVERRGHVLDDDLDRLAEVVRAVSGDAVEDLERWCDELIDRMGYDGDDDVAVLALRARGGG